MEFVILLCIVAAVLLIGRPVLFLAAMLVDGYLERREAKRLRRARERRRGAFD